MGLFTCILFGIIACWIASSVKPEWNTGSVVALFVIGLSAGIAGCGLIEICNIANYDTFNVFGILLSILFAGLLTWTWSKRPTGFLPVEIITEEE